jgi:hypothetical protein
MALQAATSNLTAGKSLTVDADGLIIDGVIPYTSGGTDVAISDGGTGSSTAAAARLALGMVDALDRVPIANGGTGSSTAAAARLALGMVDALDRVPITNGGTGSSTAAAARLALGLVDANDRTPRLMNSAIYRSGFIGNVARSDITVVAGSFVQSNDASATDFDDLWVTQAAYISSGLNDECKISGLVLNAGTYVIKVVCIKNADGGILEILHGTTSLGTYDQYNAGTSYNQIATFTYSPTVRNSGDLRFRCTTKNASSSGYTIRTCRIQIMKTA